ncbi:helix-turn-helix domain-containing protein, partial [Psychromonas sp.]|uniref:helix-turn-helix domain-containing protein n=1 Tax=Psychromonas sp. TaxID=1884585 RepID=UPI003565A8AC
MLLAELITLVIITVLISKRMNMLIRKAYKFRLNTNAETAQLMTQYAGNTRFLWNKALAM